MTRFRAVDPRRCALGEGPLWHPERRELFWVDILAGRLLGERGRAWDFDGAISALGWVDRDTLLVAHERALLRFDIASGARAPVVALDAEDARTRSNDGRADPFGGFWIGTMGKGLEPGLGAIWRLHRGALRRVFAPLTIPNAIAFAPGGGWMTFADTPTHRIMRVDLDAEGWPSGAPTLFADLSAEGWLPDGAVFDAEGALWVALYDAGRLLRLDAGGRRIAEIAVPTPRPTCAAFGGEDFATLFVTTAALDAAESARAAAPLDGRLLAAIPGFKGVREPGVVL